MRYAAEWKGISSKMQDQRSLLAQFLRFSSATVASLMVFSLYSIVDGLFVAVGTEPNTEFLGGALQCDETGYIVADESCATEVPGVFAAGDVRTKFLHQVVTAVSDGAVCAEEAAEYLAI